MSDGDVECPGSKNFGYRLRPKYDSTHANVVRCLATCILVDFQPVRPVSQCSDWHGEIDAHLIFINAELSQHLFIQFNDPSLLDIVLSQRQSEFGRVPFSRKRHLQLVVQGLFGECGPFARPVDPQMLQPLNKGLLSGQGLRDHTECDARYHPLNGASNHASLGESCRGHGFPLYDTALLFAPLW